MSKVRKTTAIGIVALIQLVSAVVLAQQTNQQQTCDVSLSRSKCGRLTRIESGENFALIQFNPDQIWKAFTMNNGQLDVKDSQDTTPSYGKEFDAEYQKQSQPNSPLEDKLKVTDEAEKADEIESQNQESSSPQSTDQNNAELQKLLSMPLEGAKFSTKSGHLTIDSSNGNKWALKSNNGQHTLYGDPQGNTMAALNLNDSSAYSNILVQNETLAVFVDKQCQLETVASHKRSYEQATEIGNLKRQAARDNSHGGRPNMPFQRRPPPPPFGGPGFFSPSFLRMRILNGS